MRIRETYWDMIFSSSMLAVAFGAPTTEASPPFARPMSPPRPPNGRATGRPTVTAQRPPRSTVMSGGATAGGYPIVDWNMKDHWSSHRSPQIWMVTEKWVFGCLWCLRSHDDFQVESWMPFQDVSFFIVIFDTLNNERESAAAWLSKFNLNSSRVPKKPRIGRYSVPFQKQLIMVSFQSGRIHFCELVPVIVSSQALSDAVCSFQRKGESAGWIFFGDLYLEEPPAKL